MRGTILPGIMKGGVVSIMQVQEAVDVFEFGTFNALSPLLDCELRSPRSDKAYFQFSNFPMGFSVARTLQDSNQFHCQLPVLEDR